ncbi:hypothetical protein WKI45_05930 [Delftia tsuruhatensis]
MDSTPSSFSRRAALSALLGGLAGPLADTAAAQSFPSRPMRLVVLFPAGGGTGAGHWVQYEAAAAVNTVLGHWLATSPLD